MTKSGEITPSDFDPQTLKRIKNNATRELARRHFWNWCNYVAPDFYTPKREYLKTICKAMEDFEDDDTGILIVDAPPRFGKSRTLCLYVEWLFGRNNKYKVMTGSYNEILSGTFAKSVRDSVGENYGKFSWTFPNTRIKKGDGAMSMWSLEGSEVKSYLATSPSGTATGFGADFIIVDDIIKSAYEANNPAILDKHWEWFTNTMYSRLEGKRKILIFMTQWSSGDLPHRAKEHFESIGVKVKQLLFSAVNPDGTMLDDDILPREEYENKKATLDPVIFECNYNNVLIESSDALYSVRDFHTYAPSELPAGLIKSRIDSADEGSDWLVKITYIRSNNVIYLIDVYMTKDKMEISEPKCAKLDNDLRVNQCIVESNNGGKGFARMVEMDTRALGNSLTRYDWKPTTANKEARILTQSTRIQNVIYFPSDWATRWRDFYNAFSSYKKSGRNQHDDAPDCLTAICEDEFETRATIHF